MNYQSWPEKSSIYRTQIGTSLLELLMAITISGIAFSAVCETLTQYGQRFHRQQTTSGLKQESRIGLEVLSSEVRMAGTGSALSEPPLLIAEKSEIRFTANLSGFQTVLAQAVQPGQQDLVVENGLGWPDGKQVLLCSIERCASNWLARNGRLNALQLTTPVPAMFPAGSAIFVSNRVRYYLSQDEQGIPRVMREVDGGAGTLISGVDDLRFDYFDKNGSPTTHAALVSHVRVTATLKDVSGRMVREIGLRT